MTIKIMVVIFSVYMFFVEVEEVLSIMDIYALMALEFICKS